MECLNKVIPLSRTECQCSEENRPVDYNEGLSDFYLDELEGLPLDIVKGAEDCESGNLWELMEKARENGTKSFVSDLLSCLQTNLQPKRPNYSGILGQQAFNSTLSFSETTAGQVLKVGHILGAYVKIKKIGLILNTSTSVQVKVYNNDENTTTPIATYTINAVGNTVSNATLATPLELPLWSNNVSNLEYYFVYTVSGFMPKNNSHGCVPCGTGEKNPKWKNWLNVQGIRGNTTDYASFTTYNELMGLILTADLYCNSDRLICSDEYPLNFKTDGYAMKIAETIRYKAGALLCDAILSSSEINRYTMLDRDSLYGKRNYFRKKAEDQIAWLCSNTPYINNDCFVCKKPSLVSKGALMS
jgi:hypothetical protein